MLTLRQLTPLIEAASDRPTPTPLDRSLGTVEAAPLTPTQVYSALSSVKPADAALVNESTSTMVQQARWLPTLHPVSFFATGSGGIGWGVPAAVGVALGDRARGRNRAVIATIGGGSFQYSIQAIWTAGQLKLPVLFVVMRNGRVRHSEVVRSAGKTSGVAGLDLPDLDIESLAIGFGCRAVTVDGTEQLVKQFEAALSADGPTVIVVPTRPELPHLG